MVVDTSAIIAILRREPEAESFAAAIADDINVIVGAPTLFEARLVLISQGSPEIEASLAGFVVNAGMSIQSFGQEAYDAATEAFRNFGKGRHPARLNFGDCMSYAISKTTGDALLFKGRDFSQTDVRAHPASVTG